MTGSPDSPDSPDTEIRIRRSTMLTEADLAGIREEQKREDAHWRMAEARFLEAWKEGVKLVGPHLFGVTPEEVDTATDRDALRPDREAFLRRLGTASDGEVWFLLQMYGYYNSVAAADLQPYHVFHPESVANRDLRYREIVARFMLNYTGW
ncbi:MAG: hypothetical protein RLW87_20730 [Alphaproteobacteria bacterium]